MKKFTLDLLLILALGFIAVYLCGENPVDVAKEIAILYGVLILIGVLLSVYIGWALTRAMNPRIPREPDDGTR